jgi:hypothetical protein
MNRLFIGVMLGFGGAVLGWLVIFVLQMAAAARNAAHGEGWQLKKHEAHDG